MRALIFILFVLFIDFNVFSQIDNVRNIRRIDSTKLVKYQKTFKRKLTFPQKYIYYDSLMLKEMFGLSNLSNKNISMKLELRGSKVLIEGDIILGDTSHLNTINRAYLKAKLPLLPGQQPAQVFQSISTDESWIRGRWNRGVVQFEFGAGFTTCEKNIILESMNHIIKKTNVKFIRATNRNENYILFKKIEDEGDGSAGSSFVGRSKLSDEQEISLSQITKRTVIHEVCHALGLYHEQSREDRDDFVKIHFENIPDDLEYNFEQHIFYATDIEDYDFASIMHYDKKAFSVNGQRTISIKSGQNFDENKLGITDSLSAEDIAAINYLYPFINNNTLLTLYNNRTSLRENELSRNEPKSFMIDADKSVNITCFVREGQKFKFKVRNTDEWKDDGEVSTVTGITPYFSRACLEHSFENLMSMLCILRSNGDDEENNYFNLGEKLGISEEDLNRVADKLREGKTPFEAIRSLGEIIYEYEWVAPVNGTLIFRANECDDFRDNAGRIKVIIERIDKNPNSDDCN